MATHLGFGIFLGLQFAGAAVPFDGGLLITEAADQLITEAGDSLVSQAYPVNPLLAESGDSLISEAGAQLIQE